MNYIKKCVIGLAVLFWLTGCSSTAGPSLEKLPAPEPYKTKPSEFAVLFVSDIHFDPLYDPALISRLTAAPASQWGGIFESSAVKTLPQYGSDTNYPLLKSAFAAMKETLAKPEVIVIGGDFLPHKFEQHFNQAVPTASHSDFEKFADKTHEFIALTLRQTFPNIQIVPTLGNNDSSCGNYMSQPHGPSLATFARVWDLPKEFSAGGYYSTRTAQGSLRLVVLNDDYWAKRYKNKCGNPDENPGQDEMAWLAKTLRSGEKKKEKVWLIGHIPAGLDVAGTLLADPKPCAKQDFIPMWDAASNSSYLGLIEKYRQVVRLVLSAHTHMNDFRVLDGVPSLMAPSIGPNHRNNPAFRILAVDDQTLVVRDAVTYALDLASSKSSNQPAVWKPYIDFDRDFHQTEVSAASIKSVIGAAEKDPDLQNLLMRSLMSGAPELPIEKTDWNAYACNVLSPSVQLFSACYCR